MQSFAHTMSPNKCVNNDFFVYILCSLVHYAIRQKISSALRYALNGFLVQYVHYTSTNIFFAHLWWLTVCANEFKAAVYFL